MSDPHGPGIHESSDVYSSNFEPPFSWPRAYHGDFDDGDFLGVDIDPNASVPNSRIPFSAPSCTPPGFPTPGGDSCDLAYFDLDGVDLIDIDLYDLHGGDNTTGPIWRQDESGCIWPDRHLVVTMDDDDDEPWWRGISAAPTGSRSPGGATFGSKANRDELIGLVTRPVNPPGGSAPSHGLFASHPVASETELNWNLRPDPTIAGERWDDDVDALDVLEPAEVCPTFLFSPDHEAHAGMSPGSIYQFDGATLVEAVNPGIHLGLPPDTDIDAFELVWMEAETPEGYMEEALVLLFSVDGDDPSTPADESGGLVPGWIYGSFLDGSHFTVLQLDDEEDIDGIAASPCNMRSWAEGRE